ncbi:hypothetical protein [Methylobacterium sp. 77]|uniref:hypothetical protein n=1 Tax=Methylobacterium sp. 77 TaxID=1101192 RepID=UPI00047E33B5|nr:hypothetical protein [Methylobacterium sp. 77]
MKSFRIAALTAFVACAGFASASQAAPMSLGNVDVAPSSAVEHVQYGYGYGYGHSARYLHRKAVRQDIRRQQRRYYDSRRRAWRYGY